MKIKTLLMAAVIMLGMSAAAFAQATFSVGSTPVTAVVKTGLTENTGAITFSIISGTTGAGTLSITYPVPITSPALPAGAITIAAGGLVGGCVAPTVNAASDNGITSGQGVLVVTVNAGCTGGFFSVSGVRVSMSGSTLSTNISANLSAVGNAITAGQTSVVVITSVGDGISTVTTGTTGVLNSVTGVVTTAPVIKIKEGFLNAWGDALLSGLRITVSGTIPAGVTLTFPATSVTDGSGVPQFQTMNSDGTVNGAAVALTSTSTSLAVYYKVQSATDPAKQETLTVTPVVTVSGTATLPLASATLTFTVSMAPIGTAFSSTNTVITTAGLIPRYTAAEVGPGTLLTSTAPSTTLLIPYATYDGIYNTGIAIGNTTTDPGTVLMGFATATKQSGGITFYLYGQKPSATGTQPAVVTYSTIAGSPGTGLDATGLVPTGSTYVVLLSNLLSAANQTSFTGYIIAICNFTNGHGQYVLSNFTTFSQGALMLVLGKDNTVAGTGRTNVPEAGNN